MSDTNSEENENKIPYKMARLAWPKAKYGVILAVVIIIIINLILYKDSIFSFFLNDYVNLDYEKKFIKTI